MQKEKITERALVFAFKRTKTRRDGLKESLKGAQEALDRTEARLIEFLEAHAAVSTATYKGLGYAQVQKPRLYAHCRQEEMERLFDFLKRQRREDLIKTTVLPQSLSGFTAECIEEGVAIPECIRYYLKTSIRLYPQ